MILIIGGDDTLGPRLEISAVVAFMGTVDDTAMGAKLEFGEEGGVTVLVVDPLIVLEKDGALVVWENELGHGDNNW